MADETERQLAELEEANANLQVSLDQCREMVRGYRQLLAANTNEPVVASDDEREA